MYPSPCIDLLKRLTASPFPPPFPPPPPSLFFSSSSSPLPLSPIPGVFLACWTPFFVVHVTNVLCVSCKISPTLISVVTWLGYVNSAVNPVIYTAFNAEFRNVFHKLLCCRA